MMLYWQRIGEHPHPLPTRSTAGSAGYDLAWSGIEHGRPQETAVLYPGGGIVRLPTGWAVQIPEGHVGLIRERSGLAAQSVSVRGGVIDSDYRGEIVLLVASDHPDPIRIKPGQRIAQLLILPCLMVDSQAVAQLGATVRGADGFGSTGE